jgi:uncharacterized protein (DUF433 family)
MLTTFVAGALFASVKIALFSVASKEILYLPVFEFMQEAPLGVSEDGTIRIAGTRVTLDSVVHHYGQGATAEEIALQFPALGLAQVHACLAYYLSHQDLIQQYLHKQEKRAHEVQQRITEDSSQEAAIRQLRDRIKNRLRAREDTASRR